MDYYLLVMDEIAQTDAFKAVLSTMMQLRV